MSSGKRGTERNLDLLSSLCHNKSAGGRYLSQANARLSQANARLSQAKARLSPPSVQLVDPKV